ncbi:YqaA family protein [Tunicatimonas pelagia]|uniref:YqaA family protein n=1 Tax=Tunicatimonas pelagia TaxID=931531 RepID=UPI002665CD3C|nr:VTT domain-containing protein [Tunicatimonas pelagia]WKN41995.1 VTT domain-containing protein [Tunicatimonas pelagia]
MSDREKLWFFARNLARGVLALIIVVGGFILLKDRVNLDYFQWLAPIYEQPVLVYLIYSASELLFGIIPPEIFMIWALRLEDVSGYLLNVGALALISYLAGVLGYLIGNYLNHTRFYTYFRKRVFGHYERYFQSFGAFLIVVAALTPLPFSGVSMLIGSVDFPAKKYLVYATIRFVRFAAYSYVVWQANAL